MKNGQKEPFEPVQESTSGTKIRDFLGPERAASGSREGDRVSPFLLAVNADLH